MYARVCANEVFASVLPKTKIASLIPAELHTNVLLSIAPSLLDRRPAKEIEIATRYDEYDCADDAFAFVCKLMLFLYIFQCIDCALKPLPVKLPKQENAIATRHCTFVSSKKVRVWVV